VTKLVYPSGPVTPHGRFHIRKGDKPMVSLQSYNDQIIFWLMGGQAKADPTRPECVQVTGLKGLIPPWQTVDQQGATEDGVTFVDALYDPMEVELKVLVRGRDAKHCRRVMRHLIESIDVKQRSELGWMTHELGYWWASPRWFKSPPDDMLGHAAHQELTLVLRADNGFWQSYPDLDSFGFRYADVLDEFSTAYPDSLGPNWPQYYDGDGGGYHYTASGLARWRDDPDDLFTTKSSEVVNGPYKDFHTATDNQVAKVVLGSFPEWSLPENGANDIWVRMNRNPDGTWAGDGVRARVQLGSAWLACYVNYEVVWNRVVRSPFFIPGIGDHFTLVAGYEDKPRLFKILRGGAPILTFQEQGTTSQLGASHRGVGFGVRAAGALITQATPATVRRFEAGDNAVITQSGFLKMHNAGDQPGYPEITFYGPATKFEVANGPGSTDMVEFGPLGVGEIAHLRTDPRRKQVFDYTEPVGAEVTPALFGASPSDTMFRKLKGRFTADCVIPPKQPGMRVAEHLIACSIQGGDADSRIETQLTPLRRYPQ
jgi:hypothetical protein